MPPRLMKLEFEHGCVFQILDGEDHEVIIQNIGKAMKPSIKLDLTKYLEKIRKNGTRSSNIVIVSLTLVIFSPNGGVSFRELKTDSTQKKQVNLSGKFGRKNEKDFRKEVINELDAGLEKFHYQVIISCESPDKKLSWMISNVFLILPNVRIDSDELKKSLDNSTNGVQIDHFLKWYSEKHSIDNLLINAHSSHHNHNPPQKTEPPKLNNLNTPPQIDVEHNFVFRGVFCDETYGDPNNLFTDTDGLYFPPYPEVSNGYQDHNQLIPLPNNYHHENFPPLVFEPDPQYHDQGHVFRETTTPTPVPTHQKRHFEENPHQRIETKKAKFEMISVTEEIIPECKNININNDNSFPGGDILARIYANLTPNLLKKIGLGGDEIFEKVINDKSFLNMVIINLCIGYRETDEALTKLSRVIKEELE